MIFFFFWVFASAHFQLSREWFMNNSEWIIYTSRFWYHLARNQFKYHSEEFSSKSDFVEQLLRLVRTEMREDLLILNQQESVAEWENLHVY